VEVDTGIIGAGVAMGSALGPTETDMTAMLHTSKNPRFKIIPWLAVFKRCAPQEMSTCLLLT